jgi:subtilisin-like proprotein convertase family protein
MPFPRNRSPRPALGRSLSCWLRLEILEVREVPSASAVPDFTRWHPAGGTATPAGSPAPVGLTPAQIRSAYGFDAVAFGSVTGTGEGQTIAIIDAYDNPKFVSSTSPGFASSDLHYFDAAFGLPDPVFTKVNQSGGTAYPTGDTGWGTEIALDVEWAHAVAPRAAILLVEANSPSYADLFAAVVYAKSVPGVSAVSMSFGGNEFSGETSYDDTFTTPAGHAGVTFLASTGDSGAPGGYPAYSPRVVAVGGTRLTVGSDGSYGGETGWSGSGGGVSTVEAKPGYQAALTANARRSIPDVALDADPASGAAVYDSYSQGTAAPWIGVGGTSLSAPMWAGLIAVADQGRALAGQGSLDGFTQTLPKLYALAAADFHDVTAGNNGFAATAGYDLVTGLGTPIAPLVARDLIDASSPPVTPPVTPPPPPPPAVNTYAFAATGLPAAINDLSTTSTSVTVPTDLVISKLTVTLTLTHTYDSDLVVKLVSPSGRVVTLSNRHGGSGDNYTGTVFDSTASKTIASAAAPFTGTFAPDGTLAGFTGLDAKGAWTLRVSDVARLDTGSLKAWTLTVTGSAGVAGPAVLVSASPVGSFDPRAPGVAWATISSTPPTVPGPATPTVESARRPAGEPDAVLKAPAARASVGGIASASVSFATVTDPDPVALSDSFGVFVG